MTVHLSTYIYIGMFVCNVWMDGWMDGCLYVCMPVCLSVCLYVSMYVCLDFYVCMYVCIYIYTYIHIYIYTYISNIHTNCFFSPVHTFIRQLQNRGEVTQGGPFSNGSLHGIAKKHRRIDLCVITKYFMRWDGSLFEWFTWAVFLACKI